MYLASSVKAFQELPLLSPHSKGLVWSPLVVIPEQVKETVDQKTFNLAADRMPRFHGLA
jgi:hypothetical protein